MIGPRKTYQDVARELSAGLAAGTITLGPEEDAVQDDLASLSSLMFRFLSPTRLTYAAPVPTAEGAVSSRKQLVVEVEPGEYERLADEIKGMINSKLRNLEQGGVQVEIRSRQGEKLAFE